MFKDGKASYTNQFIPSPRFSIERELGEEYFPNLGEYKGMLGLMKLMFHSHLVKEKIDDMKTVRVLLSITTSLLLFIMCCVHSFFNTQITTRILNHIITGCTSKHKYNDVQEQVVLSSRS